MKKSAGQVHDKHARVHFRRGNIAPLHSYPSAEGQNRKLHRRSRLAPVARYLLGGAVALSCLAGLAIVGLWVAVNAGVGHDAIVRNAQAALRGVTTEGAEVSIGHTGLSFDASSILALEASDISLKQRVDTREAMRIGAVRLGLNLPALLTGEIRIGRLLVANATVDGKLLDNAATSGPSEIKNGDGLYDPERITAAVFDIAQTVVGQLRSAATSSIVLKNVTIRKDMWPLQIAEATLRHTSARGTEIDARMTLRGHPLTVSGEIIENEKGGFARIGARIALTDVSSSKDILPQASARSLTVVLTGGKPDAALAGQLHAHIEATGLQFKLRKNEEIGGRIVADTQFGGGTGKFEIASGTIELGHSHFPFSGAIAPQSIGSSDENPTYRWEMVSNDATLTPADTEEASVNLNAKVAGTFDPESRTLAASDLGVRTDGGEVIGTASLVFAEPSPAAFLALRVTRIPVAHAKQLWPWLAGPKARQWVVKNLFDGVVTDSRLELAVAPGRLTDNIPLTAEEISGHFNISGTRFDIVGDIPPVREADGVVDFAGPRVDISLSKGIAYMPGGRTVAASNGTLVIEDANVPNVIGRMKIDVAGDAASIVELASREPIQATEKLGMAAEEFSGDVTGTVEADLPLESEDAGKVANWQVHLDFSDLAVSREFDGQRLTDAAGTLSVNPEGARFEANGKLNGLPSKLLLIEPLGAAGPEKQRDIAIQFDDKARQKVAPGLNEILSGPVTVNFKNVGEKGKYRIEADLQKAVFKLPWIGWKKGKGIPAIARFTMTEDGDARKIDDFEVSSDSFAISGNLRLSGDTLIEADLPSFRLNRNDNVAVKIARKNSGYTIAISGKSFDGRALIRHIRDDDSGETESGGNSTPIALTAQVDSMAGFHDETLRSVRVEYASDGKNPAKADMSAIASSGGAISITDTGGKERKLHVQAADAGALLRFLDYYENMKGGEFDLSMGGGGGNLAGQVDIRNFELVNEPRLRSIVEEPAPGSDGRSLNDAVKGKLNTSRVTFDRGFVQLVKSGGSLTLKNGVLRGPMIGTTFQGTAYDPKGNISVTGTFMPAYGLNRIFGEIPVLGLVLGNGRDRGLIGITYKLTGAAEEPKVQINPISVIAPGIFRSIFEFR